VKSLMRQMNAVEDLALNTVMEPATPLGSAWGDDAPPLMTVRVSASDGEHELAACSAAAVGYSRPRPTSPTPS
jgi:hypothetical protein